MSLPAERVWALVPCHREPPAAALLAELGERVGRVLVVDDGMPREAANRLAGAETLRIGEAPSGKGNAIAAGLEYMRERDHGGAVLVVDSDGQHPVHVLEAFLAAGATAELVIGNRFADPTGMPLHRRLANFLTSILVSIAVRQRVHDSQCGMRLVRGRALHEVPFPRGGYESETLHLKACVRAGIGVAWVPIPAVYRDELSSFRALRDGRRVLRAVFARSADTE